MAGLYGIYRLEFFRGKAYHFIDTGRSGQDHYQSVQPKGNTGRIRHILQVLKKFLRHRARVPPTINDHFTVPTSVDVDAEGRIYVSDFVNNRIQVFDPEGRYLKTLPVDKPARVVVDPLSGEIFAFSWPVIGLSSRIMKAANLGALSSTHPPTWSTLARLGTFDKLVAAKPRKILAGRGEIFYGGATALSALIGFTCARLADRRY